MAVQDLRRRNIYPSSNFVRSTSRRDVQQCCADGQTAISTVLSAGSYYLPSFGQTLAPPSHSNWPRIRRRGKLANGQKIVVAEFWAAFHG
jgi:hypothetical protein